jgi:hypothetical protein
VNRTNVFDLGFHINRLAESATLMSQEASTPAPAEMQNAENLRPLVLQSLRSAIYCIPEEEAANQGELKLTVLAHWENGEPAVDVHVEPLPPRPVAPVKVQVCLPWKFAEDNVQVPRTEDTHKRIAQISYLK